MTSVGSLEEEAAKRRERLKAMRDKSQQKVEGDAKKQKTDDGVEAAAASLPKPVFRSYKPKDENLQEAIMDPAKPGSVEDKVQEHMDAGKSEELLSEVDLTSLAPRKPDWDLKRDSAKKLEKLERRTQRAIAELIRDRLKEGGEKDLAQAMDAATAAALDEGD